MAQFPSLHQLQLSDRFWAGDKAISLSRLIAADLPILPGWVIGADHLSQCLDIIEGSDPLFQDFPQSTLRLDVANPWQLQQVAHNIQQAILNVQIPLDLTPISQQLSSPVAILRPSLSLQGTTNPNLEHHTAGLLGSLICGTQPETLKHGIQTLWTRLFSAKSLLYWQRLKIALTDIRLAMIVQPIASAEVAGKATLTSESMTLEVVNGLGLALTRGEAIPTVYVVQGTTLASQRMGRQTLTWSCPPALDSLDSLNSPLAAESPSSMLSQDTWSSHGLKPQLLTPEVAPTLSTEQLAVLQQALHKTAKIYGPSITVEWLFAPRMEPASQHNASFKHKTQLYLTQAYLNPAQTQPQPLPTIEPAIPSTTALAQGLAVAQGQVIAPAIVIENNDLPTTPMPLGRIIVAESIQPDWIPYLKGSVGLISEQGGFTSHAAILARELGIPAVVGVPHATAVIVTGNTILLDGDRGSIYTTDRAQLATVAQTKPTHRKRPTLPNARQFPPTPLTTQLMVTLSQGTSVTKQMHRLPIDGVGLIRAELMLLPYLQGRSPQSWLQPAADPPGTVSPRSELLNHLSRLLIDIAQQFAPRPVRYRALDLRPHEFQSWQEPGETSSPSALDIRGTFRIQQQPDFFALELTALAAAQQAGCTNLQLMLPFVRTVEEFRFCRQLVDQAGLFQTAQFQLWMMAEVPSVLFLLPEYVAAGAQGIAIGSNDLTQLMLGIDRDQPAFTDLFNQGHPAVMGAIAQIIRLARQAGVPTTLCGTISHPQMIQSLVQWGITAISVESTALVDTAWAIAAAEQHLSHQR